MGDAKQIRVEPIRGADASRVIRSLHYSGKHVRNSQLHYGVFLDGACRGAMQFGPSLDKRKIIGLVADTSWGGFIELNRMAFADTLPRNSESRAIGYAMRHLRKHQPQIEWVVSFADATQCGDGTIYRASGFILTQINENRNLCRLPDGTVIHKMTLESSPTAPRPELGGRSYYQLTDGRYNFRRYVKETGGEVLKGFQLRYIYFLNPAARDRLTVPEIPFSEIRERGATMYRGERA